MKKINLPPLLSNIRDGNVTWQRLENLDYELLGYFLSCHLIIEHYLDESLQIRYPKLDWEGAKLTFGQKISLLSKEPYPEKYNAISAIKQLNSLRNKLSHNIDFKISEEDLLPITNYLRKLYGDELPPLSDPMKTLELFTSMVCVWFASGISFTAEHGKISRK